MEDHIGAATVAPTMQTEGVHTKRVHYVVTTDMSAVNAAELREIVFA
jgi:hypothetical protein